MRIALGIWLGIGLAVVGCGADDETEPAAVEDAQTVDSGAEAPPVTTGHLDLVTYNVHGLPAGITEDDTNARMTQIGPRLSPYDIAGIQEDFTEEGHALLDAGVTLSGKRRFSEPAEGRIYGSGLTVWFDPGDQEGPLEDQIKEVDFRHEHYTLCNGYLDGASDCLASKGFQVLRLRLADGVEVDVYNSHLEAGGGDEDNAARESHVEQLIAAMNGFSKDRAVIFLGDTNLHGDDPVDTPVIEHWLSQAGLRDVCDEVGCPKPGRIDKILIRSGGGVTLTAESWSLPGGFVDSEGTELSDHDPIAARVRWDRDQ